MSKGSADLQNYTILVRSESKSGCFDRSARWNDTAAWIYVFLHLISGAAKGRHDVGQQCWQMHSGSSQSDLSIWSMDYLKRHDFTRRCSIDCLPLLLDVVNSPSHQQDIGCCECEGEFLRHDDQRRRLPASHAATSRDSTASQFSSIGSKTFLASSSYKHFTTTETTALLLAGWLAGWVPWAAIISSRSKLLWYLKSRATSSSSTVQCI